ncbi:winged helix DNA-binding protein [Azospirillum sp. TSO35-2]|uniref:winged helix DNA-binding protein n=1 Tax=Azospirillum sp. TSO35-2 TaxID=716796 RepID=UPI000D65DE7F|nr:winged helix DNA-binding protein [Azospirillum sp. TSO35-2]
MVGIFTTHRASPLYPGPGPVPGTPLKAASALDELCLAHEHLDRVQHIVMIWIERNGIRDLTPLQMAILYTLSREPLQPTKLSKLLFNRERPLTHSLKPLARRGLIEERPHAQDKRAKLLHITDEGAAILRRFGIDTDAMDSGYDGHDHPVSAAAPGGPAAGMRRPPQAMAD